MASQVEQAKKFYRFGALKKLKEVPAWKQNVSLIGTHFIYFQAKIRVFALRIQ